MLIFLCILSSILPLASLCHLNRNYGGKKRRKESSLVVRCVIYRFVLLGWGRFEALTIVPASDLLQQSCRGEVSAKAAWMNNYCSLTRGQGNQGMKIYNRPSLKPFSNEEARAMKRRGWGTCDALRSPGNKRDFSRGETFREMKGFTPTARYVLSLKEMRWEHGVHL